VAKLYTVLHPMLLHAFGSLHGKLTVVVASAAVHPHGFVSTEVDVQAGTRQDLQAVPVLVTTGQLTLLQGLVEKETEVVVMVAVAVVTCVATDVRVEYAVVLLVTVTG